MEDKNLLAIYLVGVKISDSIGFLLYPNQFVGLFFACCKELLKEERKETKIRFKFQLYFGFYMAVTRKLLPGPLENSRFSLIRR